MNKKLLAMLMLLTALPLNTIECAWSSNKSSDFQTVKEQSSSI